MHDDVIKWKHFPRYWPFVRGIHRSPVNSPRKGQWRGALVDPLICVWINGWVSNREAGDLRRYRTHYDATVVCALISNVRRFTQYQNVRMCLPIRNHCRIRLRNKDGTVSCNVFIWCYQNTYMKAMQLTIIALKSRWAWHLPKTPFSQLPCMIQWLTSVYELFASNTPPRTSKQFCWLTKDSVNLIFNLHSNFNLRVFFKYILMVTLKWYLGHEW